MTNRQQNGAPSSARRVPPQHGRVDGITLLFPGWEGQRSVPPAYLLLSALSFRLLAGVGTALSSTPGFLGNWCPLPSPPPAPRLRVSSLGNVVEIGLSQHGAWFAVGALSGSRKTPRFCEKPVCKAWGAAAGRCPGPQSRGRARGGVTAAPAPAQGKPQGS